MARLLTSVQSVRGPVTAPSSTRKQTGRGTRLSVEKVRGYKEKLHGYQDCQPMVKDKEKFRNYSSITPCFDQMKVKSHTISVSPHCCTKS